MGPARASGIFPSDARRKLYGMLIQQVPSGSLHGQLSRYLARIPYPVIEIRQRVIVDHQGRVEDWEITGLI